MAAAGLRLFRTLPCRLLASNGLGVVRGAGGLAGSRESPLLCQIPTCCSAVERVQTRRCLGLFSRSSEEVKPATESEVVEKVTEEIESISQDKVFAVVHLSGRQFKITPNDLIVINRIQADVGEYIFLQKVLLAGSENFTLIGTPLLSEETVRVAATVVEHGRSAKVIVFKKKRRKNYKRKRGHRQETTVLRINEILLTSEDIK